MWSFWVWQIEKGGGSFDSEQFEGEDGTQYSAGEKKKSCLLQSKRGKRFCTPWTDGQLLKLCVCVCVCLLC